MDVQIYGQTELEDHIKAGNSVCSHLISIGNPGRFGKHQPDTRLPEIFKKTFSGILRLEFFDVLKKEHLGSMRPKRVPLRKDVKKVIRFYNRTKETSTGYAVHCWRGVSRSTAIALGILYLIHGDEQKAIDELKRIRPEAGPHPGLVKYFDTLLGCDLSSKNDQLREIRNREMKEWFMNEIEEGDATLEELEPVD